MHLSRLYRHIIASHRQKGETPQDTIRNNSNNGVINVFYDISIGSINEYLLANLLSAKIPIIPTDVVIDMNGIILDTSKIGITINIELGDNTYQ